MIYARASLREISSKYLVAVGVLVVVFAIEKFDYIARVAIEHDLSSSGFLTLFLSLIPAIIDKIVPIATLVAVYLVVLNMRERREFIILAAAGAGPRVLMVICGAVAVAATVFAAATSGFVKPAANHAFRKQYEASLADLVSKGPAEGRFFVASDTVVYVWSRDDRDERKMRAFGFEGKRLDHVFLSDCARMQIENGRLYTDACEARAYRFKAPVGEGLAAALADDRVVAARCPTCEGEAARLDIVRVRGGRSAKAFDMQTLFRTIERNRIEELSVVELLESRGDDFVSRINAKRAAVDLLLSLANMAAVAIALIAVALTTHRTRFVALPAAIGVLMGIIVAIGSGGLVPRALLTPLGLAGVVSVAVAVAAVVLVGVLMLFRDLLTTPRMGRA
ncbi:MAG: LptF/LptG family permease [Siculibacillus sp.]